MDRVEVVGAHQERVTVRAGSMYVKIDSQDWRIQREVEAIAAVTVPTPDVLWHHAHAVALREVTGVQLGRLGEPSTAPAGVWSSAGALARAIHSLPAPPWPGWDADDFSEFVDGECRWLIDNEITSGAIVKAARERTEPALRSFPMVFTHGDYQPAHILYEDETITGIIDWADACPGDALFDLAILTVDHEERLDDVVRGYGADVDVRVIRGWWAVRRLTSIRWMIEHGYDATGDLASLRSRG